MDREEYERELKDRQRRHLDGVRNNNNLFWKPCAHDLCPMCHGTGIKIDGSPCVHMIACNCPKCSLEGGRQTWRTKKWKNFRRLYL